jgi:sarcosine oxidase gamma subunit
MVDAFTAPVPDAAVELAGAWLSDESATPKGRTWDGSVPIGKAQRHGGTLTFSVAPGEWVLVGSSGEVDLTHVRAMFRIRGPRATAILAHLCSIDLGDTMTPNGAAARTLVAGVATEVVRDDADGDPSYLLLMSRSFARHTWDRLVAVGSP